MHCCYRRVREDLLDLGLSACPETPRGAAAFVTPVFTGLVGDNKAAVAWRFVPTGGSAVIPGGGGVEMALLGAAKKG